MGTYQDHGASANQAQQHLGLSLLNNSERVDTEVRLSVYGETLQLQGCGSYYDRGLSDIQVKSQCQAAYAYSCQNHSQGVSTTCGILDGFASISSNGNPRDKCPYCD